MSKNISNRVVLTGAGGTGKSSVIEQLDKSTIYNIVTEVARIFFEFLANENLTNSYDRPTIQQFIEITQINNFINYPHAIFDRGLPDELGYRKFFNVPINQTLLDNCKKYRYDKVFFFPFWEEIYKQDDVRKESTEEAKTLDLLLRDAYSMMDYNIIEVPKVSVEERVQFILNNIN